MNNSSVDDLPACSRIVSTFFVTTVFFSEHYIVHRQQPGDDNVLIKQDTQNKYELLLDQHGYFGCPIVFNQLASVSNRGPAFQTAHDKRADGLIFMQTWTLHQSYFTSCLCFKSPVDRCGQIHCDCPSF